MREKERAQSKREKNGGKTETSTERHRGETKRGIYREKIRELDKKKCVDLRREIR